MRTWIRASWASLAGLALCVLSGPLFAGPLGSNGYAVSGGVSAGGSCGAGGCSSGSCGVSGAAGCGTGGCATGNCGGPKVPCPPKYCHVFEGPPGLKFKRGCPRPVCDPCELPHFGYFQTCWSPWPYPPDWRHCPYPTASDALPAPQVPPFTPRLNQPRPEITAPRRVEATEPERPPQRDKDKNDGPDMNSPPTPPMPPKKPEILPPPGKLDSDKDKDKGKEKTEYSPMPNVILSQGMAVSPMPVKGVRLVR